MAWLAATEVIFGSLAALAADETSPVWFSLVAIGLAYPMTFLAVFISVALVAAATRAMDGGRPTAAEGFRVARERLPQIAGWSLLAAGVGVALDQLAERLPFGGRVASWLLGAAWSIITLFAVPILALEGCGARQCVRRSAAVFRQQWGESVVGSVSIYAALGVASFPACLLFGAGFGSLAAGSASPLAVLSVLAGGGLLGLTGFVALVMRELFALSLYRYATEGVELGGFTRGDFESALKLTRPKRDGGRWFAAGSEAAERDHSAEQRLARFRRLLWLAAGVQIGALIPDALWHGAHTGRQPVGTLLLAHGLMYAAVLGAVTVAVVALLRLRGGAVPKRGLVVVAGASAIQAGALGLDFANELAGKEDATYLGFALLAGALFLGSLVAMSLRDRFVRRSRATRRDTP